MTELNVYDDLSFCPSCGFCNRAAGVDGRCWACREALTG